MDGNAVNSDSIWMQLAIDEARKGLGLTSPNPTVGAVIIKDGQLLGQGWHTCAGEPHAEREAIADVVKNYDICHVPSKKPRDIWNGIVFTFD